MSLVFSSNIDIDFKWGHRGQLIGGYDVNELPIKVGDRISFRFCETNLKGHIYYDMKNFKYVIVTEVYNYVHDFNKIESIKVVGGIFDRN